MKGPLRSIKPGNAIRLVAIFAQPPPPTYPPSSPPPSQTIQLPDGTSTTIFGTLFNPAGPLNVILHDAAGNSTTLGTPTNSSVGIFYIDTLIPLVGAWPGTWTHRWYQQGVSVDANFLGEKTFEVEPLNF